MSGRTWTSTRIWREDGRRWRRYRVKRVCNGCHRTLGDATLAEIDGAIAGLPLPDTRTECGCATHTEDPNA